MRIIIVTAMFPPIQTGTSFFSKNLADTFAINDHEVIVISTNNNIDKNKEYPYKLLRLAAVHIPLKNFFMHLRFCSLNLLNYKRVNQIVIDFQPDVILLINHYLDIAFPAIYAARKSRIPLIVSVGTQLQSNRKIRNKILKILDRAIVGNFIFPFAEKIVSWDKEIERYLYETHIRRNAEKSHIIPYGVNGEILAYEKHTHDYDNINQIIGIGAIIDQRNYLYAIRIFNEIIKYYPNLIFKIIGNEYIDKPRVLARSLGIKNKVVFMGERPYSEVIQEISKSFLGINIGSGHYTGLGTASIEIMLMGVPLISHAPENLFGSDALLEDMKNYIYADCSNVKDTVSKIIKVIENKNFRTKIGQQGKQFVQKFMNWDLVSEKYIDLFKSVLNERGHD